MDQQNIAPVEQVQDAQPSFEALVKEHFGHEPIALKEMLGQYPGMSAELQQLKANSQISPYVNPFVEKINTLFKEGATPEHVLRFSQIQNMNFDKMSPEQLIRTHLQLENSVLDSNEVELLLNEQLGSLPDPNDDPESYAKAVQLRDIKAKLSAEKAKQYLNSQKTELEKINNPETEQRRALQQGWDQVLTQAVKEAPVIDLSIDFEDGGKYTLPEGYKPKISNEQFAAIKQVVLNQLVSQGVQLNEQGLQMANQMIETNVRVLAQEDILRTVISDVAASVEQAIYKKLNTK